MLGRLFPWVLLLSLQGLLAVPAVAQECAPDFDAWISGCVTQEGGRLLHSQCPGGPGSGRALLSVEVDGLTTRLDVATDSRGFVQAGGLGISPVGEFPVWAEEPEGRRQALDLVQRCFLGQSALLPGTEAPPAPPPSILPWRPPWLLGLALLLLSLGESGRALRRRWKLGAGVVLGGLAIAGLRVAVYGLSFFHQDGHAPAWVYGAMGHPSMLGPGEGVYGPGYAQLFGWVRFLAAPERALFWAQALLGGLALALALTACWRIAPARSKEGWGAWFGVGALLVLHPSLATLSGTESYFATGTSLLLLASAALLWRDGRSWVLLGVAALLVAQVARIHPMLWMGAAVLPLMVWARRGRAMEGLRAALGIALMVALCSGAGMWAVLHNEMGGQWLPTLAQRVWGLLGWPLYCCLLALGLLGWRRRELLPGAVALMLLVGLAGATDLLSSGSGLRLGWAYRGTFLGAALGVSVALLVHSEGRAQQALFALLLGLGVLLLPPRSLPRPTDVEEQMEVLEQRHLVPEGAVIAHLGRAGRLRWTLPLPPGWNNTQAVVLREDDVSIQGADFYYRSSLCSTPEGQETCARIEQSLTLEPLWQEKMSAIPSLTEMHYVDRPVRAGMYRVKRWPRDRASPSGVELGP